MRRLYISLDEILDTRLAIIVKHNHGLVRNWLAEAETSPYHQRESDAVLWAALGWREQTWHDKYALRNKETLKDALVTHAFKLIYECWHEYSQTTQEHQGEIELQVDVNLAPYQLETEEKDFLHEIITSYLPMVSAVNFIWCNEGVITPSFFKQNYQYVILYDFYQWTQVYGKRLRETLMPLTQFIVPKLYSVIPDKAVVEQSIITKQIWEMGAFQVIETALSPRVGLRFVDVRYFTPIVTPFIPSHDQFSVVSEEEMDQASVEIMNQIDR